MSLLPVGICLAVVVGLDDYNNPRASCLTPFAFLDGYLALKIWHELPAATRKYIAEVEEKPTIELVPE